MQLLAKRLEEISSMRTSEQITAEIERNSVYHLLGWHRPQRYWKTYGNKRWLRMFIILYLPVQGKALCIPLALLCRSLLHDLQLFLAPLGTREVLELLESPPKEKQISTNISVCLLLRLVCELAIELSPGRGLLCCSIFISLEHDQAEYCRNELHRLLDLYAHLVTFAYVRRVMCDGSHPEVALNLTSEVQDNLGALLEDEPGLADFFQKLRRR